MTKFDVGWHKKALDQLADLYLSASNPQTITQADEVVSTALARNAHLKGKPVDEQTRDLWKALVPAGWTLRVLSDAYPLQILYSVSQPDRKACV